MVLASGDQPTVLEKVMRARAQEGRPPAAELAVRRHRRPGCARLHNHS